MFRRFGTAHCRILLHLQVEITDLIKELDQLDVADSDEDGGTLYRLRRNEWYEGWDRTQKDLLEKLQEKLSVYGIDPPPYIKRQMARLVFPIPWCSILVNFLEKGPMIGGELEKLIGKQTTSFLKTTRFALWNLPIRDTT